MTIRLMRGQVVIREHADRPSETIWTPERRQREITTHRGTVLAMGPPALIFDRYEVPYDFDVGDVVQYHFAHHREAWTHPWTDGKPATWVPQASVDAVIRSDNVVWAMYHWGTE